MKAVLMTAAGSPEVLQPQDVDEPQIELPTQIKVDLKAAGVNPLDTKLRSRGVFYPDALPAILGCDGAGVVAETGSAVKRFRAGDEVWFCHGGLGDEQGNYAQYNVLDESVVCRKPASLDFINAAAGPLVLITAWEALFDRARIQAGQTVLVHGGAGGVGHVAIQLAKKAGARVFTTVSTPEKLEFVRFLGADEAILYHETDFVDAVKDWTAGRGVDVVLDTQGGETFRRSIDAVAHYGDLVTLLDPGTGVVWKEARNRNLRINFVLMLTPMMRDLPEARAHQVEILEQCGKWIDSGVLKIHVGRIFPLERAAAAHTQLEEGDVLGKIVLTM